jgi:AhpD family alkylhydroperoxidase
MSVVGEEGIHGATTPPATALAGPSAPRGGAEGLAPALAALAKLRAAHLNRGVLCADVYAEDARAAGVPEPRLRAVSAWRETRLFAPRERAALAWAEAVMASHRAGVPDAAYVEARAHFSDDELVALTGTVVGSDVRHRLASLARRREADV